MVEEMVLPFFANFFLKSKVLLELMALDVPEDELIQRMIGRSKTATED